MFFVGCRKSGRDAAIITSIADARSRLSRTRTSAGPEGPAYDDHEQLSAFVIFEIFVIFVPEPSARFSRSTLTARHAPAAALKGCARRQLLNS